LRAEELADAVGAKIVSSSSRIIGYQPCFDVEVVDN
jgi:hypothetical protein